MKRELVSVGFFQVSFDYRHPLGRVAEAALDQPVAVVLVDDVVGAGSTSLVGAFVDPVEGTDGFDGPGRRLPYINRRFFGFW